MTTDTDQADQPESPEVEHCPICHVETDTGIDDGENTLDPDVETIWRDDHNAHHGTHGCPQCDREAGYPR